MSKVPTIRLLIVIVGAALLAGLGCDNHKPGTTATQVEPTASGSASSSAGSLASAAPSPSSGVAAVSKEPPPPEWTTCSKNEECALVNWGRCCAPCDPLNFKDKYTAVNSEHKAHWSSREGCDAIKCPACAPYRPDYARSSMNFFALCQEAKCVAVDLRFSKYSECQTAKDCSFRFGLGCCEGCGDGDLVTYNPRSSLDKDVCPKKIKCPPVSGECQANRHPQHPPECVLNRCQLSD